MKEYIAVRHEEELIIERELVRCKDCKHGNMFKPNVVACEYVDHPCFDGDWFCPDGEKNDSD